MKLHSAQKKSSMWQLKRQKMDRQKSLYSDFITIASPKLQEI